MSAIYWGSTLKPDTVPGSRAEANYDTLEHARAEFRVCGHYTHESTRVAALSAGSYGGDILDESNSVALEEMARAWIDDERSEGDGSDVDYDANGATITVCVDPATIDPELLAEIIGAAEGYADYPVLDESDYSEREMVAWDAAMDWATRNVPDEHKVAVAEYVTENYSGYAEPGYVADEWVTEAMVALGFTTRRVRLALTRYGLNVALVLARDADNELAWFELGRVRHGGITR